MDRPAPPVDVAAAEEEEEEEEEEEGSKVLDDDTVAETVVDTDNEAIVEDVESVVEALSDADVDDDEWLWR